MSKMGKVSNGKMENTKLEKLETKEKIRTPPRKMKIDEWVKDYHAKRHVGRGLKIYIMPKGVKLIKK